MYTCVVVHCQENTCQEKMRPPIHTHTAPSMMHTTIVHVRLEMCTCLSAEVDAIQQQPQEMRMLLSERSYLYQVTHILLSALENRQSWSHKAIHTVMYVTL